MKNFNILRVHGKMRVLGFFLQKANILGDCQKKRGGGVWTVCRFKGGGGLGMKEGGGVFEGGG